MKPELGQLLSMILIFVGGLLALIGGAGQYYFGQKQDEQKDSLYSESQKKIESQNQVVIESQSKLQAQVDQIEFLKRLVESQQKDLKGYTAGIGGYLGFAFSYDDSPNSLGVEAHNPSAYPALGAYGYWGDLDDKTEVTLTSLKSKQFNIGDLHPQRGTDGMLRFNLSRADILRANIFLVYNAGGSVCMLRVAKVNNRLVVAFKIETSPKSSESRTVIPDNFPKDFPGYTKDHPEGIFQ